MRTRTITSLALALLFTSCAPDPPRPDVVIVVLDTLRPDRLGAYGYDRGLSPALDAIAEESVVYDDCQSPAPWTAPSLISLMTAVRPAVHGVTSFPVPGSLSPGVTTLAEVLRDEGYDTAAFTEGGYAQPSFGLGRGFDVYPTHAGDEHGFHSNVEAPSRLKKTIDQALVWLARERTAPRLLFVHTYEVHHPLRPPEVDLAALRPGYSEEAELARVREVILTWNRLQTVDEAGARILRRHSFHHDFAGMPSVANPDQLMHACAAVGVPLEKDRARLNAEELEWLRDLYDAEVRYTDRQLARLFLALEQSPSPNGTILVVTSDHGEGLGQYGRLGHGQDYSEELMRVLLMIRAPGLEPGRVASTVRTIDIMPTVLALADIDAEHIDLQGRPLLADEPVTDGHAIGQALSSRGGRDPRRSLKRGRFRLVWNSATDQRQLFDLESDPGELVDVSGEFPELTSRMKDQLAAELEHDRLLRRVLGDPEDSEPLSDAELDRLRALGYVDD